ncbi:MAG TPA: prepilin-type N-terminal cleavage/methylation domain-containing protein [Methylomirabilota bacterium]|nr:prepilin-type N-terminal cleavage/methylation domain-containing protein [Methylomirabilota bacterium]
MFRTVRNQRGVTLVELMVVVAIIAIIAAIAITLYQDVQKKAKLAADQGVIAAMRSAIAIYYGQHNGNFPGAPGNYVTPSPPAFQCVGFGYTYDSATGLITVSGNLASGC